MPSGLVLGLLAALAWGFTEIAAAIGSRRFGSLVVVAAAQAVGFSALATLLVLGAVTPAGGWPAPTPEIADRAVGLALLCGVLAAIAYLSSFQALRIGPISVVSPVISAYGGLTVILAVVFRGETLHPLQAIGAFVATVGIGLVGFAFDGRRSVRIVGPGVLFAVVALVTFAVPTTIMADPIRDLGWLPATTISRASNVLFALALLGVVLLRRPGWSTSFLPGGHAGPLARWSIGRRAVVAVLLAGALDIAGMVAFSLGLATSQVWIVGLTSSFGPVIAIIVAVLGLGERPRPVQWLGLLAIGFGILLIGQG